MKTNQKLQEELMDIKELVENTASDLSSMSDLIFSLSLSSDMDVENYMNALPAISNHLNHIVLNMKKV